MSWAWTSKDTISVGFSATHELDDLSKDLGYHTKLQLQSSVAIQLGAKNSVLL